MKELCRTGEGETNHHSYTDHVPSTVHRLSTASSCGVDGTRSGWQTGWGIEEKTSELKIPSPSEVKPFCC